MSKVIRLTEADLTRIIGRVINEQPTGGVSTGVVDAMKTVTPGFTYKNKTVKLYNDYNMTSVYDIVTLDSEPKFEYGGEITIKTTKSYLLKHYCNKPNEFTIDTEEKVEDEVYSKSLSDSLDKNYCRYKDNKKTDF